MVQYHQRFLAAACGLLLAICAFPQDQKAPELVMPFVLKLKEMEAGNPLLAYSELLRLQKEYVANEELSNAYWQARATVAGFLGEIADAQKSWSEAYPRPTSTQVMLDSPLEGMKPRDAVAVISEAADKHSWIMAGEEHVQPQTRSILVPLLRELRKKGFDTLAVETLYEDVDATVKSGYPTYKTGYYTADPVFAAGIREALRLGYKLVPYEAREQPKDVPADDPEFAQNFRENLQAKNLKERIYDRNPKAKVLVWAGRAHVLETAQKGPSGAEWRPMAHEFKRMTGVDPFSVYLATYTEQSERRHERPTYTWATDRGLVERPTIFVDASGKPFGDSFDAQVFFPRTRYVYGRPDWLARELGRAPIQIPRSLLQKTGLQLAQAFLPGEPETAVPVDQALVRPGAPAPALMLPSGKFSVRVIDSVGKEQGRADVVAP